MTEFDRLFSLLSAKDAGVWLDFLEEQLAEAFNPDKHGRIAEWQSQIDGVPNIRPSQVHLDTDAVQLGRPGDIPELEREQLKTRLIALLPWRKGPYELFGLSIDTEWRSDWKWNRLKNHISPLSRKWVLDVGCGNGYHCWRMLGVGAELVIGIDPLLLNVMQFRMIKKLHGEAPVYVLPLGIEQLPGGLKLFDTVFSMGVLYHRRSPIDHLLELKQLLKPGGELILETLVIDGGQGEILVPEDRYANMRNVWFIASIPSLIGWLKRCGFVNIRPVDVTPTTIREQRRTEWMPFHSLSDFLDPENPLLTIEGLPAPKRAIVIANAG